MEWVLQVRRAATGRRVILALLVAMAFNVWFFSVGPYGQMQEHGGILDERFGDSAKDHLDSLEALGDDGRSAYRSFLFADLVYPLLQAMWMTGLLALVAKRWRAFPALLLLAPAAALVSDWIENLAFLALLGQYPDTSHGVAVVAVVFQWSKLLWNAVAVLAALAFVAKLIMNPIRRRR